MGTLVCKMLADRLFLKIAQHSGRWPLQTNLFLVSIPFFEWFKSSFRAIQCIALSDMTHMSAAHFSPPTQQFPSPPHRPSCPHCPCRDHQKPETGYITISHSCLLNTLFSIRMWILETWKIFMLNVILEWDGWSLEMSCSVRVRGCAAWLRLSPLAFNGMLSYQVLERTRASYLTLHRGWSHWLLYKILHKRTVKNYLNWISIALSQHLSGCY